MKQHSANSKQSRLDLLASYCDSAIILCGGKGSRLGGVGKHLPKCLLKVGDKTLLEHHIRNLENIGVGDIYFVTGYLSQKVEDFVNSLSLNSRSHFVEANELGTGGSIKKAANLLPDEKKYYFIVMADVWCQPDLYAMLEKSFSMNAKINILGAKVQNSKEYGIIIYDENGRISAFKEKVKVEGTSTVDAGYYLFEKDVFKGKRFPEKFSIEYDLFAHAKNMYVTEHDLPWIDVGTIARLKKARSFLQR